MQSLVRLLEMMVSVEPQTQAEASILLANVMTSSPNACMPILPDLGKQIYSLLTGSVAKGPEAHFALGTVLLELNNDEEI